MRCCQMRWQRYPSRSFHSAEQREAAQQSQAGARTNHTPVIPPSSQHGRHPGSSASAGVAAPGVTSAGVTSAGVASGGITAAGRADRMVVLAPSVIVGWRLMCGHRGAAPEPALPLSTPAEPVPAASEGDGVVGAGSVVRLVGVGVLACSAPDGVAALLDGAGSVVVAVLTTSEVTVWVTVVGSADGVPVSVVSCTDVPPLPPSTERPPESPPASGDPLTASIRVTAPREDAKTAVAAVTARTRPVPTRRRVGRGRPGSVRSGPGREPAIVRSAALTAGITARGITTVRSSSGDAGTVAVPVPVPRTCRTARFTCLRVNRIEWPKIAPPTTEITEASPAPITVPATPSLEPTTAAVTAAATLAATWVAYRVNFGSSERWPDCSRRTVGSSVSMFGLVCLRVALGGAVISSFLVGGAVVVNDVVVDATGHRPVAPADEKTRAHRPAFRNGAGCHSRATSGPSDSAQRGAACGETSDVLETLGDRQQRPLCPVPADDLHPQRSPGRAEPGRHGDHRMSGDRQISGRSHPAQVVGLCDTGHRGGVLQ